MKFPKTRTTGFGPISFESLTVSLPSGVFAAKSGAAESSFGPSLMVPISPANRPRTRVGMDGTSPGEKPAGPRGIMARRKSSAVKWSFSAAIRLKSESNSSRESLPSPPASMRRNRRVSMVACITYGLRSDQSRSSAAIFPSPLRSSASNRSAGPSNLSRATAPVFSSIRAALRATSRSNGTRRARTIRPCPPVSTRAGWQSASGPPRTAARGIPSPTSRPRVLPPSHPRESRARRRRAA